MLNKFLRAGLSAFLVISSLFLVVSCEEDFTNIGTDVVSNTKFSTKDTILYGTATPRDVPRVRTDALETGGILGQYLLGVSKTDDYKKIEASIITQLTIDNTFKLVDTVYGSDTTVVTSIDTAFIKLPYQITTDANGDVELDSVFGDRTKPIRLNVYQINRYLNELNPTNPAVRNQYFSDDDYDKISGELNAEVNFSFIPSVSDTVVSVKHRLSNGVIDSIVDFKLSNATPFAVIPLDENKMKTLFLDEVGGANLSSQEIFNNYFRGMLIEAFGDDNSILSISLGSTTPDLVPSVEIFYTNTILVNGTPAYANRKQFSLPLGGIRNSIYKVSANNTSGLNNFPIQGTAGSEVVIDLFGPDNNNDGVPDTIEELRAGNLLVNDASVILSVDQSKVQNGIEGIPLRLFMYKEKTINGSPRASQIVDVFTEGTNTFGGFLDLTENNDPDFYEFKITDYISDILNGNDNYFTKFVVKVASPTDYPRGADTIVTNYNWNPKGITLFNGNTTNGDKRIKLKISYSEKE